MPPTPNRHARIVLSQAVAWIPFIFGVWLSVVKIVGPHFDFLPGDLGDNRFINTILEHFHRWITGKDPTFWNAGFFYPFPKVITLSDNLIGAAPFYSLFRSLGLDRETAFQGWFVIGFFLNYGAAVAVLLKLKFKPLAAGVGAFLFSFGLPLMHQENHAHMFYRFGVPLACYFLWRFYERPRLTTLSVACFFVVWQFYMTVYIGFFLILLLAAMAVLMPVFQSAYSLKDKLLFWPRCFKRAWTESSTIQRLFSFAVLLGLSVSLFVLFRPYLQMSSTYGFTRRWDEIATMLPRRRSYFQADSSQIWGNLSRRLQGVPMRWEHQLFPGLAVLLLVFAGIAWRPRSQNRSASWLYLWAVVVLVGMTFYFQGATMYRLIWPIPGLSNVRVVTRLTLVLLWPMSFFIAYVIDAWLRLRNRPLWLLRGAAVLVSGLLMAEALAFNHLTVKKADAQSRLEQLKKRIPVKIPQDPILIVAEDPDAIWYENELDAMLVAQDLGLPVMNGYSSNFPGNYGPTYGCAMIPERIAAYMHFAHISDERFYLDMVKRVVPIGFDDCDRSQWLIMPSVSIPPKPFP